MQSSTKQKNGAHISSILNISSTLQIKQIAHKPIDFICLEYVKVTRQPNKFSFHNVAGGTDIDTRLADTNRISLYT